MDFEYDPAKSEANKIKHGIDFEEAQEVWKDDGAIEQELSTTVEQRFMLTGMIDQKHWTCIYTYRSGRVRIISARRSRAQEIEDYEDYNGGRV
jgi:uncharacterized protein